MRTHRSTSNTCIDEYIIRRNKCTFPAEDTMPAPALIMMSPAASRVLEQNIIDRFDSQTVSIGPGFSTSDPVFKTILIGRQTACAHRTNWIIYQRQSSIRVDARRSGWNNRVDGESVRFLDVYARRADGSQRLHARVDGLGVERWRTLSASARPMLPRLLPLLSAHSVERTCVNIEFLRSLGPDRMEPPARSTTVPAAGFALTVSRAPRTISPSLSACRRIVPAKFWTRVLSLIMMPSVPPPRYCHWTLTTRPNLHRW